MEESWALNAIEAISSQKILSAQADQTELAETVGALKARVAELEAWDADKKRYKLTDLGGGMTAYSLKEGMENGEPPHHLCAACYNEGHKSIMQKEDRTPGRCQVLVCHRCGSDLYLSGIRDPEHHVMKREPRR